MMVRTTIVAVLASSCLVLGTAALAETSSEKKMRRPASPREHVMTNMMHAATPGEFHRYLEPLAGSWDISVKTWTAPDQMVGSRGHCDGAWVMSGRYLREECTGSGEAEPFQGMGLVGYDTTSQKYVSTWADTMGTGITMSEGTIDPAHRTFTYTSTTPDPTTGKNRKMRMKILDENTHVLTCYTTRNGQESREMEILYTRVR